MGAVVRPVVSPSVSSLAKGVRSPVFGDLLPRTNLLAYYRGVVDTIGLSVTDYDDVDPLLRPIFFYFDTTTKAVALRTASAATTLALASPLLNKGTMVGSASKGVALYQYGTDAATLTKAAKVTGGTYAAPSTYYVSSATGNDENPGTLEEPFATMNGARSSLSAGDTLSLAKGSVFREQYEQVNHTRVTTHGTGDAPVVSGADEIANASFSLTTDQTNTYEIELTVAETTNPHASVTNSDVLMVWEDGTRLGGRFANNQTSIAGVEANAGSYWWDSATGKLYIHPSDSSDITSNGKEYQISTRTLCLHGGDGFYCEGVYAEKCYAKTSTGQQGYPILGYDSGHYYKCKATGGWNHLIGVANNRVAGELLFENCHAEDMEVITAATPPGTAYVAYKGAGGTSVVRFKNCVAKQPTRHGTIQESGFDYHGDGVACVFEDCHAENFYFGIHSIVPTGTSAIALLGTHTAINCYMGLRDYGSGSTLRLTAKSCNLAGSFPNGDTDVNVTSSKIIDCLGGLATNGNGAGSLTVTNSTFAGSSVPASKTSSYGVRGVNGTHYATATGCTFYQMGHGLSYAVTGCDNNTFNGCKRIANNNPDYSPGYFITLSAWQAASGQDLNSNTTDPGYDAAFFEVTLPDVLAA